MPKGGKREGAGAKPRSSVPAKNRSIKFTDAEWELIKQKAKLSNKTISDYVRDKALG
jgi:uncharacterized protein (DUF1778 family)